MHTLRVDNVRVFHVEELLSDFAVSRLQESLPYAAQWLDTAPARLMAACKRSGVVPVEPLLGGNRSVSVWGYGPDGNSLVVKLAAFPGATSREAASLDALAPSGRVPMVVSADSQREVLITEYLSGALALTLCLEDHDELELVASLLSDLALTPSSGVPSDVSLGWRLGQAWDAGSNWRAAPRVELAEAAERIMSLTPEPGVVLHGDLVPSNLMLMPDGRLFAVDPQSVVGSLSSSAASWALSRGKGDKQGWRAGGGAVRRALSLSLLMGLDQDAVLSHLVFQALELACRQSAWGEWEWVSESLELASTANAALS